MADKGRSDMGYEPEFPQGDRDAEIARLRLRLESAHAESEARRLQFLCERRIVSILLNGADPARASDVSASDSPCSSGLDAGAFATQDGAKNPDLSAWATRVTRSISVILSRRRRLLRDHSEIIARSGLFDAHWYAQRYPDVAAEGFEPLNHFVTHGALEGRDPGPSFSTSGYLQANPDVAQAAMNPLVHYLRYGRREGRPALPADRTLAAALPPHRPSADLLCGFSEKEALIILRASDLFDAAWYLSRNPDVAQADMDPALHYLHHGGREGRDPGPKFSGRAYLQQTPEAAGANPLLHHLTSRVESAAAPASGPVMEPPCATGGIGLAHQPPVVPVPWRATPRKIDGMLGLGRWTLGAGEPEQPAALALRRGIDVAIRLAGGTAPDLWMEAAGTRSDWQQGGTCDAAPDRPAILRFDAAGAPVVVDAWFTTSHDLRVRLNGAGAGAVVTCLAFDPAGGEPLLSETAVGSEGTAFLDVAVINPFLPLLFILMDEEGRLLASTLLPFPSLCRGGMHHAEALGEAGAADAHDAVLTASARLLAVWEANGHLPTLDRIEVDLTGATGAERLFGADLRAWLGALGIGIEPSPSQCVGQTAGAVWLREAVRLEAKRPETRPDRVLSLLWDAVPTLDAVFAGRGAGLAPVILCDGRDARGLWRLAPAGLPRLPASLQPGGMEPFPRLSSSSEEGQAARMAAAIRFSPPVVQFPPSLQSPLPPDIPVSRLVPSASGHAASISVVLPYGGDPALCGALLAALAQQQGGHRLQVILMACEDELRPALHVLRRHFPETGHLVPLERSAPVHERFNGAAALADGQLLLVMGEGVLLHDARTLATLAALLEAPEVASATCMLVGVAEGARPDDIQLVGLGAHRRATPGRRRNFSNLALQDTLAVFPPGVWSLPAATLSLVLVRRADWADEGGFADADGLLATGFFAAAAARGGHHLATTALSATLAAADGACAVPRHLPVAGMTAARIVA